MPALNTYSQILSQTTKFSINQSMADALRQPPLASSNIFLLVVLLILFSSSSYVINGDETMQFTYSGAEGPDKWGSLSPNFTMCAQGKLQSPINIVTAEAVLNRDLEPLVRSYQPENVTLVNNKFNVAVRYPDNTGGIVVENKTYSLQQMHWHSPSEHRINGRRYAAELHLVHMSDDGNVSVVAVLYKYGTPDPLLVKINKKLEELEDETKSHVETPISFGPFKATEVRKRSHKYYRYLGSFTTPPCSQNVIWNVIAKVRTISKKQVEALKEPLDKRCKNNARPCQPMNGRHVELYDGAAFAH